MIDYNWTELRAMENHNYTIGDDINGPLLATVIVIEIVASLIANLFVLIVTLYNIKVLKQSANIFLTNLILGNLFMTIFYLPSIAVTAAAGEWVFGMTLEQKNGFCDFFGFIYSFDGFFLILSLTTLSVDRFLFIVKPLLHKRVMNTKVAIGIAIGTWIASGVLSLPPLIGFEGQEYIFRSYFAGCLYSWNGVKNGIFLTLLVIVICIGVIVVTTVWTYCFTTRFVKKHRQHIISSAHIYNRQLMKIMGMFSSLLLLIALTYAPGIVLFISALIIPDTPAVFIPAVNAIYYLNYIFNPLLQSIFRKELQDCIVHILKKSIHFIKRIFS